MEPEDNVRQFRGKGSLINVAIEIAESLLVRRLTATWVKRFTLGPLSQWRTILDAHVSETSRNDSSGASATPLAK